MNPVIKEQWTTALRSGKFEQGRGALNSGGKFCCLGVLCELAVAEGVVERVEFGESFRYGADNEAFSYTYLPHEVVVWSGVEYTGRMKGCPDSLATINDRGASFEEIADTIEQYL